MLTFNLSHFFTHFCHLCLLCENVFVIRGFYLSVVFALDSMVCVCLLHLRFVRILSLLNASVDLVFLRMGPFNILPHEVTFRVELFLLPMVAVDLVLELDFFLPELGDVGL